MSRRHLPILVEHTLAEISTTRFASSERFGSETKSKGVSCKSGCASCCYYPIYISVAEALLLYRALVSKGKWSPSFRKKLEDHRDRTHDISYEVWLLSEMACPLLDDKKQCSAYEARPFLCRTIFSKTDSHYCHPHRIGDLTGIVPREEVSMDFFAFETKALKKHGLLRSIFPVSASLLIAEKIDTGAIEFEDSDRQFLREFVARNQQP